MSSVPRYVPHYTVSDYRQWEGDWELLQGVAVAMTPSSFGSHQAVMANLIRTFGNELERGSCECQVLPELDWIVDNNTVVRPDLVIVCDGVPEQHLETPPTLIVEILSPSTAEKDRTFKYELYEQQGVQYYLLADPKRAQLEVFRLSDGKYVGLPESTTYALELHTDCQITLSRDRVFR